MATQDDIYRESQRTAAEAVKTTEELQKIVQELEQARNNPTQDPEALKLLEEQRDAAVYAVAAADEAKAAAERREEIERRLLGQTEQQYDEMLQQRKIAEEAKKEMEEIQEVLGEDAENNKEYQEAQKRYNKEQLKAQKLEQKRSLFQRFKDTKEEKGTGAAIGQLGKTAGEGAMKGLKGVFGFIKRFTGIFAAVLIPALVLFVNSPAFETAKKLIKDLIDYLDPGSPDGPFGPNGFITMLIDKFGALNLAIAGVLGVLTLKFLGFSGLKAIFVGLKTVVLALKGAFVAGLTALSSFLGIAVAPLVGIIALIAAVGYALYDTFVEVKKKFDEGASVGELIQTAIVNFVGAFGKILDFIKDLVADVLEFFGFEDLAKTFREFSFEKIIEDFLTKASEGIKSLFDFDFQGMFQNMLAAVLPDPKGALGKLVPASVYALAGIDKETGEKLEDPAEREKRLAAEKIQEEAQEAKDKEIRRIQRQLDAGKMEEKGMKARVGRFQKDVDTDRSKALLFAESKEEQAEDLKKLQDEKKKLAEFQEKQRKLQEQLEAAKSAPLMVDGKTINVNEGSKTENNVSAQPSMRPSGSTGQLAMGGGSMTDGAYL